MGNKFLYLPPDKTYSQEQFQTVLEIIPDKNIPCLHLQNNSKFAFLYFHGNSEDLGIVLPGLQFLQIFFKINIFSMEFPGYGIYEKQKISENILYENAQIVFNYLINKKGFKRENIIIVGRSLGSGIAVELATRVSPGALLLLSAFTSVRNVAKQKVGKILAKAVGNVYKNIEKVENINCPVLLIHGGKDNLIAPMHTHQLYAKIKTFKMKVINKKMNHNDIVSIEHYVPQFHRFFTNVFGQNIISKNFPNQLKIFDEGYLNQNNLEEDNSSEILKLNDYEFEISQANNEVVNIVDKTQDKIILTCRSTSKVFVEQDQLQNTTQVVNNFQISRNRINNQIQIDKNLKLKQVQAKKKKSYCCGKIF